MDCTTCQECTKSFIDGTLPGNQILEYYAHLETCPKCKEDLIINYAIVNAIRSLNDNEELSSDYVKEVDDRLNAARNAILHEAKAKRFRRAFVVLEIIAIMAFASFFPPIEKTYAFLPEDSEDHVVIEMYGVPTYLDPVIQGIYKYNDDVLKCIRERDRAKKQESRSETAGSAESLEESESSEKAESNGRSDAAETQAEDGTDGEKTSDGTDNDTGNIGE
ncbi:MAG: zf-HC2 domain-containing protein [Lachnospiraceae bacterium]|nr:zf-HC2 domain-containing protein [Lachnospiraceae bacterium]